ncbi:hypothetical protein DPMN_043778 [Dreissena polymorpha]|uniref:Uncharacterized protein n=1 Tax=Dreissena polymorpha TaxID=45954 RepID=A0A9D4D3E5_DREPO|nr:hypothetical protein DPMN_043778 [Dreissena polymorpha]
MDKPSSKPLVDNGGDCEIVTRTHERTRKNSLGSCEVVVITNERTSKDILGDCEDVLKTNEMTRKESLMITGGLDVVVRTHKRTLKESLGDCEINSVKSLLDSSLGDGKVVVVGDFEVVVRTHGSLGECGVDLITHEMTRKDNLGYCKNKQVVVRTHERILKVLVRKHQIARQGSLGEKTS